MATGLPRLSPWACGRRCLGVSEEPPWHMRLRGELEGLHEGFWVPVSVRPLTSLRYLVLSNVLFSKRSAAEHTLAHAHTLTQHTHMHPHTHMHICT